MKTGFSSFLPSVLVIDIPEIDCQHDQLFTQLEMLKAMSIEANHLPVERAEELFALLVEHCATEERLAEEAGIDFRRHGEKHQFMLKGIRKMLNDVERGAMDVFSLIRYVDYWFERHISEEDKALGIALRQTPPKRDGERFAGSFADRKPEYATARHVAGAATRQ